MSMSTGGGGRGGGRRRRPMSDINVTPMVDVMLVLLVIFMVTAPMLTVGVQVDLPQSKARQLPGKEEVVSVSINAKGEVVLQETVIDIEALKPKLEILLENRKRAGKDDTIYVRGDKAINYGRVMEVMGAINAAGFSKVALVSAQPQPKKKGER